MIPDIKLDVKVYNAEVLPIGEYDELLVERKDCLDWWWEAVYWRSDDGSHHVRVPGNSIDWSDVRRYIRKQELHEAIREAAKAGGGE